MFYEFLRADGKFVLLNLNNIRFVEAIKDGMQARVYFVGCENSVTLDASYVDVTSHILATADMNR